ncbi:MAG: hypothetical protein E7246_05015 [Lachnoclostridium sp.]|nr:hypothetical protein [Lachnoclostridium sp.]
MLITLFKKQVSELISNLLGGKPLKEGIFSIRMMIYLLLGFYLFILMFRVFYGMAASLCQPLVSAGNDWMYFALMGVMATFIGVSGSLFTANSTIYHAKDNEFLLSLPIPQWMIVFVRIAMIYLVSAVFEIMVMLPAILLYFVIGKAPIWALAFQVVCVLIMPVIAVSIACLIGWLSAVINSKIRQRAIFSVFTSLAFIGIFYYVYWNLYSYINLIIANADAVGGVMKILVFPFYQMGLASAGDPIAFVIYVVIMAAIMAIVVSLVSSNFVELAAKTQTVAKRKTKTTAGKANSPFMALFKKEFQRFTSSTISMMSCALGSVMMVAIGVTCMFAGEWIIVNFMGMPNGPDENLPLIAMMIVCMMAAMNTISATSISLEGKYIWMLKVLPVSPWQIFKAKIAVHVLITAIPAVFCTVAFAVAGHTDLQTMLYMIVATIVFVVFCAVLGLQCNLRFPNLSWTNEAQAVKQNMSVIVATFAPWGMLIVLAVVCACMRFMGDPVTKCLTASMALVIAVMCLQISSLMKRGSERFMEL